MPTPVIKPGMIPDQRPTREQLLPLMQEQFLILEVAYGSAFQNYSLSDGVFRGEQYADHEHSLQGDHDIINITQPNIVAEVHDGYLETGCDIISTNTFNATSIAQEDFATQDIRFGLNQRAARVALWPGGRYRFLP